MSTDQSGYDDTQGEMELELDSDAGYDAQSEASTLPIADAPAVRDIQDPQSQSDVEIDDEDQERTGNEILRPKTPQPIQRNPTDIGYDFALETD